MSATRRGVRRPRGRGAAEAVPPGLAVDMLTVLLGQASSWCQHEIDAIEDPAAAMAAVTVEAVLARMKDLDDEC